MKGRGEPKITAKGEGLFKSIQYNNINEHIFHNYYLKGPVKSQYLNMPKNLPYIFTQN